MGTSDDSSTCSWEAVADDWVAHADTNDYRNIVLMPLTFELIGEVTGQRILDLGCGEGGYSRELAKRGATVVGVDGSTRLVTVARQRSSDPEHPVRYICANASSLDGIEAECFDQVLAAMSLMDVEDYDGAIDEAWRVLVPGGSLLMSITHPSFSAPTAEWVKAEGELRHFAVDRYFDRVVWEEFVTPQFRRPILRRHRPLEDFVRPLLRRGFLLRNLVEPTATPAHVQQSARLAKLARIPYFLFMQWQKANLTS